VIARRSPLLRPTSSGAASLQLASDAEVDEAASLLAATVTATRRARGEARDPRPHLGGAPMTAARAPSGLSTRTWPAFALDAG
jgi:hypothetical protein